MGIACLGDGTEPAGLSGGVLPGDEAEESHELARLGEALHVAELGDEDGGGGQLETTQACQSLVSGNNLSPSAGNQYLGMLAGNVE